MVNWDAIGAIAETLGAVGVIASLVYLAGQIRHNREQMSQNTLAARASSYQHFFAHLNDHMVSPTADSEFSEITWIGLTDFGSLSEKDAFRVGSWMYGVVNAFDNALYQARVGMLDEELLEKHLLDLKSIFQSPGFVQWWRGAEPHVSPEFNTLVEEILAEEPDRGE
jgi:hypothetical protein